MDNMKTLLTTQINDTAEKILIQIQTQINKIMEMLAKIFYANSIDNKVQEDESIQSTQSVKSINSIFNRQKRNHQFKVNEEIL